MNELLNLFTANYPYFPIFTVFVSLLSLWYTLAISTQLFNWALAWVDDAEEVKTNLIHQLTFFEKRGLYDPEMCPPIYLFLIPLGAIILSVCIHFWFITMWVVLFFVVLNTMRGGRRVQKKLQSHIADKKAHKGK